jgi:hypothetical protein
MLKVQAALEIEMLTVETMEQMSAKYVMRILWTVFFMHVDTCACAMSVLCNNGKDEVEESAQCAVTIFKMSSRFTNHECSQISYSKAV